MCVCVTDEWCCVSSCHSQSNTRRDRRDSGRGEVLLWTVLGSVLNRIEIESSLLRCGAGERCLEFLGKNTVPIYQY